MNEAKLITLLNTNENYNFVAMDDKFSRYDAFDTENGIMLEIKCRKKHYDDTLLEKMKYDWNKAYALENDLSIMYAVSMPDKEDTRFICSTLSLWKRKTNMTLNGILGSSLLRQSLLELSG